MLTKLKAWLGPMLRLRWAAEGDTQVEVLERGTLWLEQATLVYLRERLVPMHRPDLPHGGALTPGCWAWVGPVDGNGVPMAYNQGRQWAVPRLLYTIQHGPLPERMQLRNLCGMHRCCKPDHHRLDPRGPITRPPVAPRSVPVCASGHPQIAENLYVYKGKVYCRVCHNEAQRRYRSRGGKASSASRSPGSGAAPAARSTAWRPGAGSSTG